MTSAQKRQLQTRRQASIEGLAKKFKRCLAERLGESRKLFGKRLYTVDPHSHSNYSDGQSTIDENCQQARLAGLDLLFATDHSQIRQKRSIKKTPYASWGQESAAGGYHVGLLRPSRVHVYRQGETLAAGIARARKLAPFVWIAHPNGFGELSRQRFNKIVADLAAVDDLAMEVLNGFDVIDHAYYRTGKWGIRVMDALLSGGCKVTPIGASDAHSLVEIGNSWTGVLAEGGGAASIIKALRAGRCFASEAPLLALSCNGRPMGSTLRPRKGAKLTLRFRAADSAGLACVRIISQGRAVKEIHAKGAPVVAGTLVRKATGKPTYFRLESAAIDDRRAFSSPIYLR